MTLDYDLLNHRFFGGKLPHLEVVYRKFKGSSENTIIGRTRYTGKPRKKFVPYIVELNARLRPAIFARLNYCTLVHEMVHVKLGAATNCCRKDGRPNPRFQKEIDRLMRLGCFKGVI